MTATGRCGPPDIAVLVGMHAEAADIQAALAERGIPAVVARGGSVLESPAADHMRWLLHALARPADPRRVRMYALSWFAGRRAAEVATLSEADMEAMQEQLRQWSEMLGTHSVADTFARVWSESGLVPRVLGAADGDRNMTDLDHLVELFGGVVGRWDEVGWPACSRCWTPSPNARTTPRSTATCPPAGSPRRRHRCRS